MASWRLGGFLKSGRSYILCIQEPTVARVAKTVLVVDDEPGIVTIVRDYLEKAGFHVLTAGDGETALRLARLERPNLMVLDLMLPGIDGLDIIRGLRGDPALHLMSVIMLTARVEEADRLVSP